jgi:hypothetical protein
LGMPRSLDSASSHWRIRGGHLKVKFEPVICGSVLDHFTADPRKIRVRGAMVRPWPPTMTRRPVTNPEAPTMP